MPRTCIIRIGRRAARQKQHGRCFWCNVEMDRPSARHDGACTADHLVPRGKGGGNRVKNIVAACRGCNSERRDNDLTVWLVRVRFRLEKMGNLAFFEVILSRLQKRGIDTPLADTPATALPSQARPSAPDGALPAPHIEASPD